MSGYKKVNRWWFSALLIGNVALLDQASKIIAQKLLFENYPQPLVDHMLFFTLTKNRGAAFGLFKNSGLFFILFGIAAVLAMGFLIYLYHRSLSIVFGFSFIIGGTVGNLIDRVLYGGVIDFIDIKIWPVFNLADSAIVLGIMILTAGYVFSTKKKTI